MCFRDVVGLHASLDPVLDTPTKCTLWKFILVSMQPQHHDYVLHRVGLPTHVLTGQSALSDSDTLEHLTRGNPSLNTTFSETFSSFFHVSESITRDHASFKTMFV